MLWGVIAKKKDGTWKIYTLDVYMAVAIWFEDVIFASYNLNHDEGKKLFCHKVRLLMSDPSVKKEVTDDVLKLCKETEKEVREWF